MNTITNTPATILSRNGLQSVTVFVADSERENLKAHSGKHDEIRLDMMENGIQRITADGVVIWERPVV
jgi:predicted Rdx family selenoprotein